MVAWTFFGLLCVPLAMGADGIAAAGSNVQVHSPPEVTY